MTSFREFIGKIILALKVASIAFKNPMLFNVNMLKMMLHISQVIIRVAMERRPYICKVAEGIIENKKETEIVTVWIGYGADSHPLKRIEELSAEVNALKELLNKEKS